MKAVRNLVLLVLVLVCAGSLWWGRARIPAWFSHPSHAPAAAPVGAGALVPAVHVLVLNGTPSPGLARSFSLALAACGLVPERVANAPRTDYPRSFLVNRRLRDDAAAALAHRLADVPVIREWDDRTTEDAILVLGADHADLLAALERRQP